MKESTDEHSERQDQRAGRPLLMATSGSEFVVVDLERLEFRALAHIGRGQGRIRFAKLGGLHSDLFELGP